MVWDKVGEDKVEATGKGGGAGATDFAAVLSALYVTLETAGSQPQMEDGNAWLQLYYLISL